MCIPFFAAVVVLATCCFYTVKVALEGVDEKTIVMTGLTAFSLIMTIVAEYFAKRPVPPGEELEIAELVRAAVNGRLEARSR